MNHFLLFDLDGVLVDYDFDFYYFLFEEYGILKDQFEDFFYNGFTDTFSGMHSVHRELKKYLVKWNLKDDENISKKIINRWFELKIMPRLKLIDRVLSLKSENIVICIATNQCKERLNQIFNELDFVKEFDFIFASCNIGFSKPEHEYYDNIYKNLQMTYPSLKAKKQVFFTDDSMQNVIGAKKYGFIAHLYSSETDCINRLEKFCKQK